MFGFGKEPDTHPLDLPIKEVLDEMERIGVADEKFPKLIVQLDRLYEMKRANKRRHAVSPDTLVMAGTQILGIVIVAAFETKHVWTSKALQIGTMKNPQINH